MVVDSMALALAAKCDARIVGRRYPALAEPHVQSPTLLREGFVSADLSVNIADTAKESWFVATASRGLRESPVPEMRHLTLTPPAAPPALARRCLLDHPYEKGSGSGPLTSLCHQWAYAAQ